MSTPLPAQRLRSAMAERCIAIPGAFNGLVAMAVADAGFPACYLSGGATSVAAGVPDVGLLTLDHFASRIRELARASGLPVLADADTGFGEEEMVRRAVVEYAHAGAAGLHLEDQVFPKRCGHLEGKQLVPTEHAAAKIRWAAEAASELEGGFVVCARSDAAGVEGLGAALERAEAYVASGAEMLFPEGLRSEDEFARFAEAARRLDGPDPRGGPYLLANMTEFGRTPMISLARFEDLGYSCVIYPVTLLRAAMGAVAQTLAALAREGHVGAALEGMQSREELYRLVGYTPGEPWRFPAR